MSFLEGCLLGSEVCRTIRGQGGMEGQQRDTAPLAVNGTPAVSLRQTLSAVL